MTPEERARATLLAEAHDQGMTGDEADEYAHVLATTAYGRLLVLNNTVDDLRTTVVRAVRRILDRLVHRG